MGKAAAKTERWAVLRWGATSVVLVCVLPWLTLLLDFGTGMVMFVLFFFAVDPTYSVFLGIFAGKDLRHRWILPFLAPTLLLLEGRLVIAAWDFLEYHPKEGAGGLTTDPAARTSLRCRVYMREKNVGVFPVVFYLGGGVTAHVGPPLHRSCTRNEK